VKRLRPCAALLRSLTFVGAATDHLPNVGNETFLPSPHDKGFLIGRYALAGRNRGMTFPTMLALRPRTSVIGPIPIAI
jgi:hypothetical protein